MSTEKTEAETKIMALPNNPKSSKLEISEVKSHLFGSDNNGGGGSMDNYITRPEFEEHKKHLDSRFDGISKDITIAKDEVLKKITDDRKTEEREREADRRESEKERKGDKKWFISLTIGTGVALLGIILQGFGLI